MSSPAIDPARPTNALVSWISSLTALTATPDLARIFWELRSQFAVSVAAQTVDIARVGHVPAVYGVWLNGHDAPVYIGQTMNARRRLWDLPIGESHHLANTFPPEIWERIIVVRWLDILERQPVLKETLVAEIHESGVPPDSVIRVIGLQLEHALQTMCQPQFNARKRTRSGGWRAVDLTRSHARGARPTHSAMELQQLVFPIWRSLAHQVVTADLTMADDYGGIVFPSRIWRALFSVAAL